VHNFPSDRGNLVANFIIDLPAKLTDEQKAALGKIL
jgi:hypothetical protein